MAQLSGDRHFLSVAMSAAIRDALRAAAVQAYPRESCGLLVGELRGGEAMVRQAHALPNRAVPDDRFLIAPEDVWATIRAARAEGQQLLGAYHSHPDADPSPSATDARDAWGELIHVITATGPETGGPTRCWQLRGDTARELPLLIEDRPLCEPEPDA